MFKHHNKAYWICQIIGWCVYGLFLLLTGILFSTKHHTAQAIGAIVLSAQLIVWTHLLRHIFKKQRWIVLPIWSLIVRVLVADLAIALMSQALQVAFIIYVLGVFNADQFSWGVYGFYVFQINFMLWIWSLIYVMVHVFDITKRGEREKWELETAVKDAELMALKAQINPHFLFNSLNNIRALVLEDAERAREMISKLSDLFRYALQVSQTERVMLKDELDIVKDYLLLEAVQLEDRLRYRFEISPETLEVEIPPMTIQTLVENAIRHGIALLPDGGEVFIASVIDMNVMTVRIVNSGQIKSNLKSDGIGLENTMERLRLLFGDEAKLTVEDISDTQVCAQFEVPLIGQKI